MSDAVWTIYKIHISLLVYLLYPYSIYKDFYIYSYICILPRYYIWYNIVHRQVYLKNHMHNIVVSHELCTTVHGIHYTRSIYSCKPAPENLTYLRENRFEATIDSKCEYRLFVRWAQIIEQCKNRPNKRTDKNKRETKNARGSDVASFVRSAFCTYEKLAGNRVYPNTHAHWHSSVKSREPCSTDLLDIWGTQDTDNRQFKNSCQQLGERSLSTCTRTKHS